MKTMFSQVCFPVNGNWGLLTIYKFFHTLHHCVKSVRIGSYSGPHFPAFGLNTERYSVSLRIQSECGKIRIRVTLNTVTFHAVRFRLFLRFIRLLIKALHFGKERLTLSIIDINLLKISSGESPTALFVPTYKKSFSESLCNKSPRLASKSSILTPGNSFTRTGK